MSKTTKTAQTQNSTATNALDPTQAGLLYGNVDAAKQAAASLTPFTGQRVADFNANQTASQAGLINVANSNVGGGLLSTAGQAATGAAGYRPLNVAASPYAPATVSAPANAALTTATAANTGPAAQATAGAVDRSAIQNVSTGPVTADQISNYMNPYTQSVVNTTNADLDRQRQIEQVGNAAQATKAGAFGGTGAAVLSSLTNDNYARQAATADAGLNQAGFNTALSAAQADQARALAAAQSNQGADLSAATTNAGLLNTTNQFNAGATNTANQVNAGLLNTTNLANAGAANQNTEFNAANTQQANLANQAATNTASQFNAGQDLAAQAANQTAGLNANGQSISAAGLLGNLSNEQLAQATSNAGLLGQVGDAQQAQQQAQLTAALTAYQQGQALTVEQQQLIQSALGLIPAQQTITQTGTASGSSKQPSNILGDLGTLLTLSAGV